MTTQMPQSEQIMKRVPKDPEHEYGATDVNAIPTNEPCIVVFGGERTVSRKDANYYASIFNRLFAAYDIADIGIYSAYYPFTDTNRSSGRSKMFRLAQNILKKRQEFTISADNKYVHDLYNQVIFPRIVDKNNKRFPDDVTMNNIHRVMIFTHCHGAAVVRAFQELMMDDMVKYGYDKRVIPQIMKQLLVVQHAPTAPIHNSMFNTVSFMSASDTLMNFHNVFSKYASEHGEDMMPSYFSAGNFFAAYLFTYQMIAEHQIVGLVPDSEQDQLTPDGAMIMAAERNAIINGAKSMRSNSTAPLSAKQLIAPISASDKIKPDFDELKQNGEWFMAIMRHDLQSQRSK